MVRCGAMKGTRWRWWFGGMVCTAAQAAWWPWSSASPTVHETPLEKSEQARLRIEVGWLPEAPEVLLIEVGNRLPGPLVCRGVSVQRKDNSVASVPLQPPVYIPLDASRRVSVPGVSKVQLKQWSLTCSCFKREGSKVCENASP
jgi:hypothetical protein